MCYQRHVLILQIRSFDVVESNAAAKGVNSFRDWGQSHIHAISVIINQKPLKKKNQSKPPLYSMNFVEMDTSIGGNGTHSWIKSGISDLLMDDMDYAHFFW